MSDELTEQEYAESAWLGVTRDINAYLEQLERATEAAERAWLTEKICKLYRRRTEIEGELEGPPPAPMYPALAD